MSFDEDALTDTQREAAAICIMRMMLEDDTTREGVSFDKALERFASSKTYEMLFDYSTRLWAEGPDYLRSVYQKSG